MLLKRAQADHGAASTPADPERNDPEGYARTGFARWATIIGALGVVVQLAFFLAWSSIFIGGLTHAALGS
jgi:hypothetical protein